MLAKTARRFVADDHGATAIEYGLIAALIAAAAIASFTLLGGGVETLYGRGAGAPAEVFSEQAAKIAPAP